MENETLATALFFLSLGVNSLFVAFSLCGLFAFFPRKAARGNTAAAWLVLAIWIGFLGVGLNVFYWRVFGDLALHYDLVTRTNLREWGVVGDLIWKGMGVVSIYLHFYARWKSIPESEQRQWTPLLMGLYPDLDHWARKVVLLLYRRPQQ